MGRRELRPSAPRRGKQSPDEREAVAAAATRPPDEPPAELIEREMRSIRRQFASLRSPLTNFALLDPLSKPQGIRYGGIQEFVFPHEGILDAILGFSQSVWHFKDYLKSCVSHSQRKAVEEFAGGSTELKIVADLANQKKHASLDRPRSGLSPELGLLKCEECFLGVVRLDTSRNGAIEFVYNGKNKAYRFWVANPTPIPYGTEIITMSQSGPVSMGDAVTFIYNAFKQWDTLRHALGIHVRKDFTE